MSKTSPSKEEEMQEELIAVCIFKNAKTLPKCQWRQMINDVPMCWRNCAGCIYLDNKTKDEIIHLIQTLKRDSPL